VQEGAKYLRSFTAARRAPRGRFRVPPGEVVILGVGLVGHKRPKMAAGWGKKVTVLDVSLEGYVPAPM